MQDRRGALDGGPHGGDGEFGQDFTGGLSARRKSHEITNTSTIIAPNSTDT